MRWLGQLFESFLLLHLEWICQILFKFHDQLYRIKRVSSKVIGKACFRGYFRFINSQSVNNDLFYFSAMSDILIVFFVLKNVILYAHYTRILIYNAK